MIIEDVFRKNKNTKAIVMPFSELLEYAILSGNKW